MKVDLVVYFVSHLNQAGCDRPDQKICAMIQSPLSGPSPEMMTGMGLFSGPVYLGN